MSARLSAGKKNATSAVSAGTRAHLPVLVTALCASAIAAAGIAGCTSLRAEEPAALADASADAGTPFADAQPDADQNADARTECSTGCNRPPKAGCSAGNALGYNPRGRCVNEKCVYTAFTTTCTNASCDNGICEQLDWKDVSPVATKAVYSVWGPAPDDIWAVGVGVYHFNGTSWTAEDIGYDFSSFRRRAWSVHGTNSQDVTIMVSDESSSTTELYRRIDGVWTVVSTLTGYAAYGGAILGIGRDQFLMNLGGRGLWLAKPSTLTNINNSMGPFILGHLLSNSLSATGNGDALVANYGQLGSLLYKSSNDATSKFAPESTAIAALGDGFGGIYAGNLVWLYRNGAVTQLEEANIRDLSTETSGYWQAMSGTSLNRIFVGGTSGTVMRRSATGWTKEPALPNAAAVVHLWAAPWGDVYAAGTHLWRGGGK
jgi:hypothetical protein